LDQLEKEEFVEKLKTKEFRDKIKRVYETGRLKLGMIHTKADPYWMDCFKILSCKNSEYVGKTIGEIAHKKNSKSLDTILDILMEDPETKWVQFLDKRGTAVAISVFLKHPAAMPCTDVSVYNLKPETENISQPAPIAYGLYPHYIRTYVKDKAVLSLEEAVMKATYLPSQRLGLKDRGLINPGAYADIVIFDFEKIRMKGDYLNPAKAPDGIEYVLVNGKIVYKNMAHTGIKAGKVLRHEYLSTD
jgi:N-acyl-D-amino-acid deacylase